MVSANTLPDRELPHKATLYCPSCAHASPITGDWILERHANGLDYNCPECGLTIESRPDLTKLTIL